MRATRPSAPWNSASATNACAGPSAGEPLGRARRGRVDLRARDADALERQHEHPEARQRPQRHQDVGPCPRDRPTRTRAGRTRTDRGAARVRRRSGRRSRRTATPCRSGRRRRRGAAPDRPGRRVARRTRGSRAGATRARARPPASTRSATSSIAASATGRANGRALDVPLGVGARAGGDDRAEALETRGRDRRCSSPSTNAAAGPSARASVAVEVRRPAAVVLEERRDEPLGLGPSTRRRRLPRAAPPRRRPA